MRRVLATAGDPGGAAAVLPVMRMLSDKGYAVDCVAGEPAYSMFSATRVFQPTLFAGNWRDATAEAADRLPRFRPSLVLVASSMVAGIEMATLRDAKRRGVPVLSVLDSWANYRRRFLAPGERSLSRERLPDVMTVMDDFTVEEAVGFGFPRPMLRVTGQPAFDGWVAEAASPAWQTLRGETRCVLEIAPSERLIAFFSQALDVDYGPPDAPTFRGYDQHSALQVLRDAIAGIDSVTLAVKPHPRERVELFEQSKGRAGQRVAVVPSVDAKALTAAADLVVSMTSVTLVQAVLVGKPVISLQPGLRGDDASVLVRMGLLAPVTDPSTLRSAIDRGLAATSSDVRSMLPRTWTDGRATERVVRIVEHLVENG